MANLNKVMLIGNLTRDPVIKSTPKGTLIADIGLAINRNYTTASGEKREEATFVDIELWDKLAELAEKYLKKGRPVYIEGSLRLDSWDDKQTGQKRTKLKVRGEVMQFLGGRDDAPGGGGGGRGGDDEESGSAPRRTSSARPGPAARDEDEEYDQRPRRSAAPASSDAGGGRPKPKPAPAADPDMEDDDIPF